MPASPSDRLRRLTLRAGLRALRGASLTAGRRRGERLAALAWGLDRRWRPLAEQQASEHLPAHDPRRLIRDNYRHYGDLAGEIANLDRIRAAGTELWSYEGTRHLEAVADGGLVITGHLGNWEILAAGHVARFGPLTALVKPIRNPVVDAWINRQRRALGVTPLRTRDRAGEIIRRLRAGERIVVLADQNSLHHEGLFVPFLGRLACTHYGPAMLALRASAPVITAFGHRRPDGGFHIRYEPPVEPPDEGDLRERTWRLTAALTARVEAAVRRHPAQWFWVHRRWKNQPRADTPAWKLPAELRTGNPGEYNREK